MIKKLVLIGMLVIGSIGFANESLIKTIGVSNGWKYRENTVAERYNANIIGGRIVRKMNYGVDFRIPLINGDLPKAEVLEKIAEREFKNNRGYERYFISFTLPEMKYEAGAYAIVNFENNKDIKADILYLMLRNTVYNDLYGFGSDGNYALKSDKDPNFKSMKEWIKEGEEFKKSGAKRDWSFLKKYAGDKND